MMLDKWIQTLASAQVSFGKLVRQAIQSSGELVMLPAAISSLRLRPAWTSDYGWRVKRSTNSGHPSERRDVFRWRDLMKTVYPPSNGEPRTLTHDEVVRVDAFSMGPADFHEQHHAHYDRRRMRKLLEPESSEEKPHGVGATLELLFLDAMGLESWKTNIDEDLKTKTDRNA